MRTFKIQKLSDSNSNSLGFVPLSIITDGISLLGRLFGSSGQRSASEEQRIRAEISARMINQYGLSGSKYLDNDILRGMINSRSQNFTTDLAEYLSQVRRFEKKQYPLLISLNDSRQKFRDYTSQIEAYARNVDIRTPKGGKVPVLPGGVNVSGLGGNIPLLLLIGAGAFLLIKK